MFGGIFSSRRDDETADAIASCAPHFCIMFVLDGIVTLALIAYPLFTFQIYSRIIPSHNVSSLAALLIGLVVILVFQGVFRFYSAKCGLLAAARIDRLLSSRLFEAKFRATALRKTAPLEGIDRDLALVRNYFGTTLSAAISGAPWAVIFLLFLFAVDFWVGVTAVAALVVQIGLTVWDVSLARNKRAKALEFARTAETAMISNIKSADAVVSMGVLGRLSLRREAEAGRSVWFEHQSALVSARFSSAVGTWTLLMTCTVLAVAAWGVMNNMISAGFAFPAVIAFGYLMRPSLQIIKAWQGYEEADKSRLRINTLLKIMKTESDGMALGRPSGRVTCERVAYFPEGSERPILSNVTFGILPGTAAAVIGAIGSGKTTLVRLLVGLTQPTRGEVRLDGAVISDWDRETLAPHFGYLPQEIGLYAGTVAENIGRFGQYEDHHIIEAAELSGVHEIILKLPQGYDTRVGEGGLALSGGQRQLIGLARAVIGTPALVVMDEPNSNLDGPAETALMNCIKTLRSRQCTVIMVSHRPALVQDMDRVILLREGTVVFEGPTARFFEVHGRAQIRAIRASS